MTGGGGGGDYKALLQQAYQAVEKLKARLAAAERARSEPIAIVGMACRTPGRVDTPEALWRLLAAGVDAITEVPRERWDVDAWYDPDPETPGRTHVRAGGFVSEVDRFDAAFFGISPREATSMDPQQRMLLEVAWEALEHAGQPADRLVGSSTGAFVGICNQDYLLLQQRLGLAAASDPYSGTGNTFSVAAGRLSYVLGLQGPNLAVDTACSSSLIAVHLACQSLRAGHCRTALAGGVNLMLVPQPTIYFSKLRALAADGRCKTFAAEADGYARGEGCGIVVLKRLSEARADGDRIVAVIRGSAVNHDGRSSGLTVPSGPAQEAVIRAALRDAGVAPAEVSYVEAHGTGTPLGDPIEVRALGAVLGGARGEPLRVGSVKTNLGHLEGAAGVIGLIKVALALEHEVLPPHLHCDRPSAHIPWHELPIAIPAAPTPWPRDPARRRIAGVSSFGFSGSNAHAVLEEAPAAPATEAEVERPLHLLTVSAKTAEALTALAGRYRDALAGDDPLTDFAFSANTGRARHAHRLAVVASSAEAARAALDAFAAGRPDPAVQHGRVDPAIAPDVAFLFTGQGAQHLGMGRRLLETQPTFRRSLERCDEILRPILGRSLLAVIHAEPTAGAQAALDHTALTQPAMFAFAYALAELWRAWGVVPSAVLGHSVGEYAAACVAGVMSLEDGLRLVAERGRLMGALPAGGSMAAVFANEPAVAAAVAAADRVAIAAVNAPDEVVISGPRAAVDATLARLAAGGVRSRALNASHAFHSPLMDPILDAFEREVAGVALSPPALTVISNLTGERLAPGEAVRPDYFRSQLRAPVQFAAGMQALHRRGHRVFVEIGPGATLLGLGRRAVADDGQAWLPSLRPGGDDWRELLAALSALYLRGVPVDWTGFDRDYPRRRRVLPSYPFQRRRFWIDAAPGEPERAAVAAPAADRDRGGALAQPAASWFHALAWRRSERRAPGAGPAIGRWLLCADRGGVAVALARLLEARGATCVQIAPGEEAALDVTGGFCGAVHLGGLDDVDPPSGGDLRAAQARGTLSALALVQQIAELSPAPTLWIATRGAQALPADRAPVALAHAPLWGLGRVIALEHPELWGGLVDLDPVRAPRDTRAREAAAALLHEISQPDREQQVAYRGGERHVARLVRWAATAAGEPSPRPLALRADRSYLIAGGLGGLGLAVARWMIACGARHLALLGRRPAEGSRREVLRALEVAGARVVFVRADLERADEVAAAIDEIARSMPALAGVIHAAGVVDDGTLVRQDAARVTGAMASKLTGGWNLHAATLGQPLDFFALFSSAAALLGSAGQGSYAAANAFLDALAHHRRALGLPAISIAWGPWSEVGVWAALGARARASHGVSPIPPARGVEALGELLGGAAAHVAVLPIDWRAFSAQIAPAPVPAFLTELAREPGREDAAGRRDGELRARLAAATADQRPAVLAAFLVEHVAAAMRSDPEQLPRDRNLVELGMDSLMVMEVAGHIKRELGLALYPREVYEYPSIAALSDYLAAELARAGGTGAHGAAAIAGRAAPAAIAEAAAPPAPAVRGAVAPAHRIPGVAFVLSSPRAGSTLLRVMLAGHPAVFCPPELHLLGFETMAERARALGASYLGEGLHRAIMEIERLDADGARRQLERWVDEDLPVQAVYAWIQARIGARWLIDKSPSYAGNPATLERAEQLFDGARYLFLFRHPYAVIESFVRQRMHKLLGGDRADPHALAEQVWADWNDHTLAFLARIPAERAHRLRYEELVRDPERAMRRVCEFLRVPYDVAVLSPYAGDRMTDGVHPQSAAIGDPGFLEHTGIDDRLADRWRDQQLARPLGEAARRVAAELDYELPGEGAVAHGPAMGAGSPRESFVDVRGLRLCVLSWGPERGPLVVCLHGILDHAGAMAEVAQRLAHRGMRVVAPDLRGHGRSGHVGVGGTYHLVDFVADVDALARALGPAPFTLVGHSLGAGIAGLFAGVRPERVSSLVLVEPALPSGASTGDGPDRLSVHLDHLATMRPHAVFRTVEAAAEQLRAAVAMSPAQALASARRLTVACDGGVQWCWDPLLRTRAGVAFHGLELPPERFRALLGRVRCPVTWVYGDRSDLRHLARPEIGAGGAREAVIPGGHNLHLDSAAELAELIAAAAAPATPGMDSTEATRMQILTPERAP